MHENKGFARRPQGFLGWEGRRELGGVVGVVGVYSLLDGLYVAIPASGGEWEWGWWRAGARARARRIKVSQGGRRSASRGESRGERGRGRVGE